MKVNAMHFIRLHIGVYGYLVIYLKVKWYVINTVVAARLIYSDDSMNLHASYILCKILKIRVQLVSKWTFAYFIVLYWPSIITPAIQGPSFWCAIIENLHKTVFRWKLSTFTCKVEFVYFPHLLLVQPKKATNQH